MLTIRRSISLPLIVALAPRLALGDITSEYGDPADPVQQAVTTALPNGVVLSAWNLSAGNNRFKTPDTLPSSHVVLERTNAVVYAGWLVDPPDDDNPDVRDAYFACSTSAGRTYSIGQPFGRFELQHPDEDDLVRGFLSVTSSKEGSQAHFLVSAKDGIWHAGSGDGSVECTMGEPELIYPSDYPSDAGAYTDNISGIYTLLINPDRSESPTLVVAFNEARTVGSGQVEEPPSESGDTGSPSPDTGSTTGIDTGLVSADTGLNLADTGAAQPDTGIAPSTDTGSLPVDTGGSPLLDSGIAPMGDTGSANADSGGNPADTGAISSVDTGSASVDTGGLSGADTGLTYADTGAVALLAMEPGDGLERQLTLLVSRDGGVTWDAESPAQYTGAENDYRGIKINVANVAAATKLLALAFAQDGDIYIDEGSLTINDLSWHTDALGVPLIGFPSQSADRISFDFKVGLDLTQAFLVLMIRGLDDAEVSGDPLFFPNEIRTEIFRVGAFPVVDYSLGAPTSLESKVVELNYYPGWNGRTTALDNIGLTTTPTWRSDVKGIILEDDTVDSDAKVLLYDTKDNSAEEVDFFQPGEILAFTGRPKIVSFAFNTYADCPSGGFVFAYTVESMALAGGGASVPTDVIVGSQCQPPK